MRGAVVALVVALAPPAQAAPAAPPVAWSACEPARPGFECATITVPLAHDDPHGATTTVALTRKPATDRAGRIGSCAFGPNSEQRCQALLDSVRAKPITLGTEVWTYDAVIQWALLAGFASESRTDVAALLDQLSDASAGLSASAPVYDHFFDANLGTMCADTEFPRTFGQYRAVSRLAEAGPEFGPCRWWNTARARTGP